nr:neck protein [uncultured Mediterranean phage uvMED]
MRRLGHPVLEINVDDDQLDDLIDDAFQYYRERHMDGVEKMYLKHEITADDVTRFDGADETSSTPAPDAATWLSRKNFIEIPEHVVGISKVMGISSNFARNNLFGMNNQYFLMDIFSFSSGFAFGNFDMSNYYMLKQYFETLDMIVQTGSLVQFRFNQRQDRLFIDIDKARMIEGNFLLIECYRFLNPDDFTQVYNDSFVKQYLTALIKRQWGQNLIKFNNVQLPGGVSLNGRQLFEDAQKEIDALMEKSATYYELPPMDMIG